MTVRVNVKKGKAMTIIEIQGKLMRADQCDLKAACDSANTPLWLDLSKLVSADDEGIRALQSLSDAGAELHEANPYIRQLLLETDKRREE